MSSWSKGLKDSTKAILGIIVLIVSLLQIDQVQAMVAPLVGAYPKLAALIAGLISIGTLLHNPKVRELLGMDEEEQQAKSSRQAGFARHGFMLLMLVVIGVLLLGAWTCSNWERTTFQSLSASKSTVDCAVAAYNHDSIKTKLYCADPDLRISQTSANRTLLDRGRKTHDLAVIAYRDYWCLAHPSKSIDPRLNAGPCAALPPGQKPTRDQVDAARQKAVTALNALPELIAQIKALK
jgi:hypothetical protein